MAKLLGILLIIVGMYFLGQNIMFATYYYPGVWRDIPAVGSVVAIMAGVISLLFFQDQVGSFGWILLLGGVVLIFLSGAVILKPTSLWNFFISFAALAGGYQLISQGRLRI
ncbi:MAG TPA: hypothetical protein V6D12_14965 [Candidatus Obscuribacterales bacterium]